MNTATVVKNLGVSRRTLMRWVNQLGLDLQKNEMGHYQFTDEDVERLKEVQKQSDAQQQPSTPSVNHRTATANVTPVLETVKVKQLNNRIDDLERKIRSKADDVVSFQVLQHRKEMEELLTKISSLEQKVIELEQNQQKREPKKESMLVFDQTAAPKKPKRKNLISSIFSF